MSRTTKWILGILIGLVAITGIAVIGVLVWFQWGGGRLLIGPRAFLQWGDGGFMPWHWMPMHPGRVLPFSRFGGFSPLLMIGGWLINLGFLVLIVLGAIFLVRLLVRPSQPADRVASVSAGITTAGGQPVVPPGKACPNCGKPVLQDWNHCPNCGSNLT